MKHIYQVIVVFLLICTHALKASTFNRSFFYRASSFWGEPRFERNGLTTLDIALSGGSTHKGRNKCGDTTDILSIYSSDVSFTPSHNQVCKRGTFDLFEANFNLYQNLCYGLFWHFHLPVVLARLSPCSNKAHTKISKKPLPLWRQTAEHFESFLEKCTFCVRSFKKAALSDASLLLGWTHSFDGPCYSDFIDVTLQAGILFPTGKKKNNALLFDIPYGYNGHWGFSFISDIALGACDWLTVGLHSDAIAFGSRTNCIDANKEFRISAGPVWRLGAYMKADHFCSPLSLVVAFAYEQKNSDRVHLKNNTVPDALVAGTQKWSRWLLHILFEYDFTIEESIIGPRIGFFYNRELAGKRVFSTHTGGGFLGLDVTWCF